ncbi:MAG: hypothetical protein OM95_08340 [Bdellovibrio sp. ArHS]|uniref:hypothetical protein n=1 Tax=Bdellovibrio sp. ArHS TaxID=1569284 RepID=UPI0005835531|nr:hypothetical protein [Bdellovibrio sp. ArHS]KHD88510.1 MAG: hypothetical protein OM95_08340 [Bdellovibrio sp. ArHS]
MKKALVSGLIVLTSSFAMAAPIKASREMLVEYTKQIREFAYGKGGSAAKIQKSKEAHEAIAKAVELPSHMPDIAKSLSDSPGRIESMMTIVAAKRMSVEVAKTDAVEGKSLRDSADASAKVIANSWMRKLERESTLTKEEMEVASKALDRMEIDIPTKMLTDFSKAERDSYTQIIERYDVLNNSASSKKNEDNFVQAIMDVKKVDRAKAIEIVKKLKECV